MPKKSVREIAAALEAHPSFTKGWDRRGPSTPLASETFGAVHHVAVCDAAGRPLWDQMIHTEPGGAVVVPTTDDGRLVLVEVERPLLEAPRRRAHADGLALGELGRASLEFPRGFAEPGETPEQTAARELAEETGLEPDEPRLLGYIYPNTAFSSTAIAVVSVRGRGALANGVEVDNAVAMTAEELDAAVANGRVVCGITLAALALHRTDRLARELAEINGLVESVSRELRHDDARRAVVRLDGDPLDTVLALASVPIDLGIPTSMERPLAAVEAAAKNRLEARAAGVGVAAAQEQLRQAIERLAASLRGIDESIIVASPPLAALEDAIQRARNAQTSGVSPDAGEHLLITACAAAVSDVLRRVCTKPGNVTVSIVLARESDGEEGEIASRVWDPEGPFSTIARRGPADHAQTGHILGSTLSADGEAPHDVHVAVVIHPANRARIDALAGLLGVAPPGVVFIHAPLKVLEDPTLTAAQRRFATQTFVPLTRNELENQLRAAYGTMVYGPRSTTHRTWHTLDASVPACRILAPIAKVALGIGIVDSSLNGLQRIASLLAGNG